MEKALQRDDHACQFCGFRSGKYQRAVKTGKGDSLVTVCLFCDQCLSLDQAGLTGSGILIWLPEVEQADLHHIMRAIYVARAAGAPHDALANQALEALVARRAEAKKRLGTDDPALLGTLFAESLSDSDYAARAKKIEGIRFMPHDRWLVRGKGGDVNHFPQIIKYWRSPEGPFANFAPDKWDSLLRGVVEKVRG